jgi:CDP-diacylglycerol--glycerol-3-phosphate 3-phosphatidyltransferase
MLQKSMESGPLLNTANQMTVLRLALLPFIILLFFIPAQWAAWACFLLYAVGCFTDWLDGWIARRYKQTSAFGTFMDPIADKIFVVTILLMLVATQRIHGIFTLAVIIILIREFLVAGLREYLGPKGIALPVTHFAKWKTTVQMVATGVLIVGPYVRFGELAGISLLCVAAGLTVMTGLDYLKYSLPHIRD